MSSSSSSTAAQTTDRSFLTTPHHQQEPATTFGGGASHSGVAWPPAFLMKEIPTPSAMCAELDKHVVGQTQAKRVLSLAVYNHYHRLRHDFSRGAAAAREAERAAQRTPKPRGPEPSCRTEAPQAPHPLERGGRQHKATPLPSEGGAAEGGGRAPPSAAGDNQDLIDELLEIDKSNIIMCGPTGSGKTLLAKRLAKMVDVPFAMVDATTLTQAGYVGEDVESILHKLLQNCGFDVAAAQCGIVYLDEVDKLRRHDGTSMSRDVSGEGVQQSLLNIVEGVVTVADKGTRKTPRGEPIQMDTSNVLFIAGGAFVGLPEIVFRRKNVASMGFGKPVAAQGLQADASETEQVDLVAFGLIPEFVGRFPIVAPLAALSEDELVHVLTRPRHALMKQFATRLGYSGAVLRVTSGALSAIAAEAVKRGTGARGLRSIVEKLLTPPSFEVPDLTGRCVVYLDEAGVRGAGARVFPTEEDYAREVEPGDVALTA